jgi:hypothetical protein
MASQKGKFNLHADFSTVKKDRLKRWITFYRRNIHRFMVDYMGLELYPYQILMVWMLQHSQTFYAVAARASAKSWLIAAFSIAKAILYPGIQIVVVAKTMAQAGIIISDKTKSIMELHPNVAREITKLHFNKGGYEALFRNGSTIKVVPLGESARGNRANDIIIEESRLVDKASLESIIKPFLFFRHPPYRAKEPYKDDLDFREDNTISYITSAHYADADWYQDVKSVISRVLKGDKLVHFIALDYLISIRHGIKGRSSLMGEMMNNDRTTVRHEYYNLPSTISAKAFFDLSFFKRTGNRAFYPQRLATYNAKKNPYGITKVADEVRILSVDVATRSGKQNDLTILSCVRLIPSTKGFARKLVYMESHGGVSTANQAARIKQVFFDFEADYLVLDTQNVGLSIFEQLGKASTDDERNVAYPAFTLCSLSILDNQQREDYLSRVTSINAMPVVFPIMASASLNSRIASEFKSSLQNKMWEFLIHQIDAENYLLDSQPEYMSNATDNNIGAFFLNPYVQTTLLIDECMNLETSFVNNNIKLSRPNGRKDRYTSVSYANFFAEILDRAYMRETNYDSEFEEMRNLLIVV